MDKAIEYKRTIKNWDDLVDPRTLALYCLEPEPSAFICTILKLKEKRVSVRFFNTDFLIYTCFFFFYKCFSLTEMTTKFNKDLYAKMRTKKHEPLSSLEKRTMRVTRKGPSATPPASVTPIISSSETVRMASPATSVEEIPTPASKRSRVTDKRKEKADSCSSFVWDDKRLAMERAHEVVTAEDLKVISGVSFNKVATRHVHKLV